MNTDEFRQVRNQANAARLEQEAKGDMKTAERAKRFDVLGSGWVNALDVAFQNIQDSGSDAFGINKGKHEHHFDPTRQSGAFIYRRLGPENGFNVEIKAPVMFVSSGERDVLVGEDQNDLENTASMNVTLTDNGTRQIVEGMCLYTMQSRGGWDGYGNAFVEAEPLRHFLKELIRKIK